MACLVRGFFLVFAVTCVAMPVHATLISVSGPPSSAGTLAAIIPPPSDALDDIVTNTGMQGFDEAQNVLTTVAHAIDGGSIPAGTLVDSHMIFLNSLGPTFISHENVIWTFDAPIIGVMSDFNGNFEAASTFELGNPLTNYTVTFPGSGPAAPFADRGMEGQDAYLIAGNQITFNLSVTEPGDWIRVITAAAAPEPGTLFLLAVGLFAGAMVPKRAS
jgi:hypothetical protein